MLTLKEIKHLLPLGYWTASLDLKDGFWHLMVHSKMRPYLGFKYRNQFYQFRAMPFGLCVAPRVFTKLIAHMIKKMAEVGIWCLPFLDDLLIIAATKEECAEKMNLAINILEHHGWIINMEKSRLTPLQTFEWLGIAYNLTNFTRSATKTSLDSLHEQLSKLLRGKMCSKRDIMRVQGRANWVGQVNPISRLMVSRSKAILSRLRHYHIDQQLRVSKHTRMSLVRWLNIPHIPQRMGKPTPQLIIQTDACPEGWGFRIAQLSYNGSFDESMTNYSINILELFTIWLALLKIQQEDLTIQILSDNSTAVAAIRRASSTQFHIHSLSELIWRRSTEKRWTLLAAHIRVSRMVLE